MRAIVVLGAFQAGAMLANLLRVKVVAVETGPAGVGLVSLVEQIVLLVALAFTLSLPIAAVKFLSFAHSQSRQSFARAYIAFRRALTALSIAGAVAALLIALAAPGLLGAEIEANQEVVLLAVIGIPLLNLLTLVIRALAASGRSRTAAGVTLAQAIGLAVGAGIGLILAGSSGYFAGGAVGLFAVLLGASVYLRRAERTDDHGGRVHALAELRGNPAIVRFALVNSAIMLSTPAAFLVARYAVLAEDGLEEVGLLAAVFGMAQVLTMLFWPAISLFLTPALNREDPPDVKLGRALEFRRSMLLAIGAAMLPLLLFPQPALEVLFAAGFTSAASYVYLFVFGEAIGLVGGIHQALLVGLDDFGVTVAYIVAGQALLTVLVIVLVPAIGIPGVGIALIADHALVTALSVWRLRRRHHMTGLLRGLAPFVPGMGALVALGAVTPSLPEGDPGILAAKIAVMGAFVAAGVVLHRRASAVERAF